MATLNGFCPECGAELEVEDPVVREVVDCPECGAELEITEINEDNIKFQLAELEGEDWGE